MAELSAPAPTLAAEGGLFADLVGQPRAAALLEAALQQRRLAPAYLFAGAEGVGRRLAALRFLEGVVGGGTGAEQPLLRRRLAQGNHPDVLWVEPTYSHQGRLVPASQAEQEGVNRRSPPQLRLEQVREISRFLSRRPVEAPGPMVVMESAEAMAEAAANALLKTLEEPGDGLLILLSAAPDQLLTTIRSRCQQIPFRRLSPEQVGLVLSRLAVQGPASGERPENGGADLPATGDGPAGDPDELLELAAGSPGALLEHRRHWSELPPGLAQRLLELNADPLEALGLARDLSEALDGEQQLWLLGWWQLARWRRRRCPGELQRLERLRGQLRSHVQPRLAWEVALLELAGVARR
ncbi:MAG: DNA polymerase III subunit delta' [Synechococcaceae cyanobacterium]|nr:DNA polymerase III subunit delta' [Synechococcaceae cyanobacterium]